MPVITVRVNVPEGTDPEEIKRLVELEIFRKHLFEKRDKKPFGDFRKLRGILGKASMEELRAYGLEAEFGDLY